MRDNKRIWVQYRVQTWATCKGYRLRWIPYMDGAFPPWNFNVCMLLTSSSPMSSANTRTSECSSFCVGGGLGRERSSMETWHCDCQAKRRQSRCKSHARDAQESKTKSQLDWMRPTAVPCRFLGPLISLKYAY